MKTNKEEKNYKKEEKDGVIESVTFNPWLEAFLLMQKRKIVPKVLRLRQVVLFCFRIDVEKSVESVCDREIIRNIIGLVKYTPGTSMFVEILSLKDIPKPSEVKKWKERNETAATELEQLTESYMKKVMDKMKW